MIGSAKNIQAYRVEGELLTTLQEVNNESDYELIKMPCPMLCKNPGRSIAFHLERVVITGAA